MGMNGSGMGFAMSPQMTGMTGNSSMHSMNTSHNGFLSPHHAMHHDHRSQHGFPGQGYDHPAQHHAMSAQGYGSHSPQPVFPYWADQPPHHGPGQTRDMQYNSHNRGYMSDHNNGTMYGSMDNIGPAQHFAPMQVNHTGFSSMHSMNSFQPSRINSPMPHHHGQTLMPPHMMGMNGGRPPHHQHGVHQGMGMQPGMHNGQTHLQVGMGGGRFHSGPDFMGPNTNARPQMSINHFNGPHPGLSIHCGEQGKLGKAHQVWITGEFFGVQRARDMLLNAAAQKVSPDPTGN